MESDNYPASDIIRKIIDTRNCVKEELGCESIRLVGSNKFSKIFSQYNPRQLSVKDAESVKYLRISHDNPLELIVTDSQMKFLRVGSKLYYTI